ncbi:histidine phosphatase family protein [Bordetella trematum]|uniref:histidine phosphatase family protein n=1 Tax=Bordetella trematum TaxID=123899 RepID=UPI000D991DAB|nr:histidine phosphatase family protein [Bordetella trematum]SPU54111.1 phosphoglycerate mutase 2 [Bordetella trematum]VDH08126.1 Phosphoglyceromutase [Bordetella trematum]
MTEIWFIRHGETDWNHQRRLQGWQDIALNATGRAQAARLATRLGNPPAPPAFEALYSSDLQRAQHTAEPLAQALALRLRTEPGMRERAYGVLEGLALDDIDRLAPEAAAAWKSRDPLRELEGGETLGQFQSRILSTVEDLAARHAGQRILVVTHGGALDIIWRRASGVALNGPREVPLLNVSINRVAVARPDWRILGWGDVAHVQQPAGDDVQP